MRPARLLVLLSVLPASAWSKEYVPPSKPPLATLTIDNQTSGIILPVTFSDPKKCSGMLMLAKGNKFLGKRIQQAAEKVTVPIDASREFTLYVEPASSSMGGISSCRIIYTFKPEEGREYVATAMADAKSCYVSLARVETSTDGGKSLEEEKSARRRELPALVLSGFGPQCREESVSAH
jgi:hypothetical protein